MSDFVCQQCGKTLPSAMGLKVHIGHKHKAADVPSAPAAAPLRKKYGPRKPKTAAVIASGTLTPEDLKAIFGEALASMRQAGQLVAGCLDGLSALTDESKRLRLAYIEKADQLRRLRVEIEALKIERDPDARPEKRVRKARQVTPPAPKVNAA